MTEEEIFNQALSRSPAERAAFLDQACAGHPALRASVEALLRANVGATGFLEQPPSVLRSPVGGEEPEVGSARTAQEQPVSEGLGTIIGPYKLLQQIGEGGMGTVFMAEQIQPVQRKVALKIIKPGMDSRQVIARFEAERQALALMDHPNIARVIDAGSTDSGRPYFVMELVKGIPITRYCDDHHLTPKQRLELMLPVCHAVQHAHQKGVIHRDLKPSNVLVADYDDRPVPKVIDFGVAKAAGPKLTDQTLFTEFGQLVGTLEYMSPEQAKLNALDIDTRSDIYALGVMLYELLTGTTPFDRKRLSEAAFDEMLRIIREEEPPRPSTRLSESKDSLPSISALRQTEPARLTKLVTGELDWIVMKALEKDRSRRYETANGFAADVQRFLADEPVLACPPSASYRLRKLVRRNKGRVLAAGLLILVLLAGITAVVAVQARANRNLADTNAQLAAANERERQRFDLAMEAVGAFHTGVSEDVLLKQKEFEPLRKKLLGGAAEFYRKLQAQLGDAADPRSQAALAKAYAELGRTANAVGSTEQALKDYGRAQELYEALAGADPDDPAPRRELVRVFLETARVHVARKETDALRRVAARAMAAAQELATAPAEPQDASNLVQALLILGEPNSPDQQEPLYRRAAEIGERLVAQHPDVAEYHTRLAEANYGLSVVDFAAGRYKDCAKLSALAAQHYEAACHIAPTDSRNRRSLTAAYETAGLALGRLGRFEEALAEFRHALRVVEELTAEQPAVIDHYRTASRHHQNMGWALWQLGRTDESAQECRRQVTILETLVGRHPDRPDLRLTLASALLNTAIVLGELDQVDDALPSSRRAVDLFQALVTAYPKEFLYRLNLGSALQRLGLLLASTEKKSEEAKAAYEGATNALAAAVSIRPTDDRARRELADSWRRLGRHLGGHGEVAKGLEALGRARELAERVAADQPALPEPRVCIYDVYYETGYVLLESGDPLAALAAFERAMAIAEQLAADYPKVVAHRVVVGRMLSAIGLSHKRTGRLTEARAALERCRAVWERLATESPKMPAYRDDLGRALANLGYFEALAGDAATALPLHQKAVALREQVTTEAPKSTGFQRGLGYSLTYLGQTYRRMGKGAEAGQALERALGVAEPLVKRKTAVSLVQVLQLETRLELGLLRLSENQPAEAAGHFSRALQAATGGPEKAVDELVLLAAIHAQVSTLPEAIVAAELAAVPEAPMGAKAHADRAMALLIRAAEKAFGDTLLLTGSDAYDPLRERDDFKKLLVTLDKKTKK
jgi:serine/threonine protein kinase/tetratricopeptide (TPR) repeat protein